MRAIQDETDTALKRRAIKSIIKINHANNVDYSNIKNIIHKERAQAAIGYGQILDYLSCKVLINDKRYEEAISLLTHNADVYKGSHMEVEMLSRAAMVYGYSMNNKVKVIEYADRIAMINPGEPQLESIYRLADLDYDPSQYYDKFSLELIDNNYNTESQPEEEHIVEDIKPVVSISPNPANPKTTISYSLPKAAFVNLDIYSITGQKVATMVNCFTPAGNHNVIFDGSHYGSGIYIYSFQTEGFRKTGKMLILK